MTAQEERDLLIERLHLLVIQFRDLKPSFIVATLEEAIAALEKPPVL